MGMKSQYFGKLCNGQRPVTVESLLKICAMFSVLPKDIDPTFPDWAMWPRSGDEPITTPMLYTPSADTIKPIQLFWNIQKEKDATLINTAPVFDLSKSVFASYLDGTANLNPEFILKFSYFANKHPREFDPLFPAFFLIEKR
jgi:hypothetical protein